jgi:hypothetical protein
MEVLKQTYPEAIPKDLSVDEYALRRMTESIADVDHNRKKALIEGLLRQHFDNLALDEDDRATALLQMARKIWEFYDSSIQNRSAPLRFDPFPEMYTRVRDEMLDPKTGLPPEYAARLRTKLGLPAPAIRTPEAAN